MYWVCLEVIRCLYQVHRNLMSFALTEQSPKATILQSKNQQLDKTKSSFDPLFSFFILHQLSLSFFLSIWYSETQTQYLYVSTHHKALHLALLARPAEPSPLVQYSNTFPHTDYIFSVLIPWVHAASYRICALSKNTIYKTIAVFNIC